MTSTEANNTNTEATTPKKGLPLFLKAYLALYVVLALLYIVFRVTGSAEITPADYLSQAFPGATISSTPAELATIAKESGKASIRSWDGMIFDDPDGLRHNIEKGEKLRIVDAVPLARTIMADQALPEDDRKFTANIAVFGKGALTKVPWEYALTVYNLLGLFLLLYAFVWGPITGVIDSQAQSTSEALAKSRNAQQEAQAIKARYEELIAEVEAEKKQLEDNSGKELAEEKEHIIEMARHEAKGMIETMESSLSAEIVSAREKLRSEIADEAVELALKKIKENAGAEDHEKALADFLQDLKQVKL